MDMEIHGLVIPYHYSSVPIYPAMHFSPLVFCNNKLMAHEKRQGIFARIPIATQATVRLHFYCLNAQSDAQSCKQFVIRILPYGNGNYTKSAARYVAIK